MPPPAGRYQEKLQECERLKLEIESEWARPVAMKDHELTRQQWVSKFKDLQDKLKAAIVDGRVEVCGVGCHGFVACILPDCRVCASFSLVCTFVSGVVCAQSNSVVFWCV